MYKTVLSDQMIQRLIKHILRYIILYIVEIKIHLYSKRKYGLFSTGVDVPALSPHPMPLASLFISSVLLHKHTPSCLEQ